jgi:hypothetical protein
VRNERESDYAENDDGKLAIFSTPTRDGGLISRRTVNCTDNRSRRGIGASPHEPRKRKSPRIVQPAKFDCLPIQAQLPRTPFFWITSA